MYSLWPDTYRKAVNRHVRSKCCLYKLSRGYDYLYDEKWIHPLKESFKIC